MIRLHRESRTHSLSPTHVPSWAFRSGNGGAPLFEKKTKGDSQARCSANIQVVRTPAQENGKPRSKYLPGMELTSIDSLSGNMH